MESELESLRAELEIHKARVQELHDSGERYRAIVESSDDAIISKDLDGIITSWNAGAERIFGYTASEMIGQPVRRLIPEKDQEQEDRILAMVRKGERVDHFETIRLHKDGSEIHLSVTVSPIKNTQGKIIGASKVGRDITARMREATLRNRLSAIVESSDDAIIGKDLEGTITSWNKSAERIFGYAAEEALGRSVLMLIPTRLRSEESDFLRRLRKGERIQHFQTQRLRKDGTLVDLSLTISPIYDERGNIIGASKVARDISSQQRSSEQIRESEAKFITLFREMPMGAALAEIPSGRLLDANPAFLRLTGYAIEDMQQSAVIETAFQLSEDERADIIQTLLRNGRLRNLDLEMQQRDGSVMSVVLNANVVIIAGQPHALLLLEDTTQRKHAESALREAARRKDEFLATLAHELRNPLAPITNALQLMALAPDDPATTTQARAMMNRQLEQLVRLVDDLMDVSRISRGAIELQRRPIDLRHVVVQAVEATRVLAEQQGHKLIVDRCNTPIWVSGDNTRLVQVLSNLLNNAVKYTDYGGHITLTCHEEKGTAVLTVTDDGTGIDAANLERVFDMFAQLDNASTRKQGGLGIGLNIVKQLVELHGGTITASSPGLGMGSSFLVRLPMIAEPVQQDRSSPAIDMPAARLRVLVTDDNVESATSLSLLLRKLGHDVRAVHNGPDSVVEVTAFKPHLVFLDIGMPGMDGYETCRCIRATSAGRTVHLVALTGWGQDEDRRLADEAGFDRHVVKPLDRQELQRILASVVSGLEGTPITTTQEHGTA